MEATKKFHQYTIFLLLKLPRKWKDYILDPIAEASARIDGLVAMANRVYISEPNQTKEELLAAIAERDKYLVEAMRSFAVLDNRRELLLSQIDYLKAESRRLTQILQRLIEAREKKIQKESQSQKAGTPGTAPESQDTVQASAQDTAHITIEVHHRLDEIEYRTADDKQTVKLGVTNHHMERWATLEENALQEIRKRYAADNGKAKKLKEVIG